MTVKRIVQIVDENKSLIKEYIVFGTVQYIKNYAKIICGMYRKGRGKQCFYLVFENEFEKRKVENKLYLNNSAWTKRCGQNGIVKEN